MFCLEPFAGLTHFETPLVSFVAIPHYFFAPTLLPQEIAPPAATAAVDADGNPMDSEAAAAAAAAGSSSGPSQVLNT
jgi:hypothetical protein